MWRAFGRVSCTLKRVRVCSSPEGPSNLSIQEIDKYYTNILHVIFTDLIRRMGEGNVFSLSTRGEGVPTPPPPWPRYLPPTSRSGWGGEGYPKVPTPHPGQDGGRGTPRYLPPLSRSMGEGGGTPRYLPPKPRYLPPWSRSGWGGGGTPRYLSCRLKISINFYFIPVQAGVFFSAQRLLSSSGSSALRKKAIPL